MNTKERREKINDIRIALDRTDERIINRIHDLVCPKATAIPTMFTIVSGGRQCGKSMMLINLFLSECLDHPDFRYFVVSEHCMIERILISKRFRCYAPNIQFLDKEAFSKLSTNDTFKHYDRDKIRLYIDLFDLGHYLKELDLKKLIPLHQVRLTRDTTLPRQDPLNQLIRSYKLPKMHIQLAVHQGIIHM